MAVGVLPGLEVIADEDRVEAALLGVTRELQQLARRELLGRRLVSELEHDARLLGAVDAVAPLVELYRLAGDQQPDKERTATMHLGVGMPLRRHRRRGPDVVREFAQTAEADRLRRSGRCRTTCSAPIPRQPSQRPSGVRSALYHDPFVLFGFSPACTKNIELSTQVLILPQRQTVLVAKQAASLDVLCRRPLPVRRRRGLERGRVHRPQRELPRPRQALRGAGRR